MRIERTQHAYDRRFEDIVIVEFPAVDVLVLNQLKRLVKIMLNRSRGITCGTSRRPPSRITGRRITAARGTTSLCLNPLLGKNKDRNDKSKNQHDQC